MAQPSLNDLLKQTSRSFYLTLRVLPRAIRSQIGLAYLLARTTDTIADTELVAVEQRLEALQRLRERILGTSKVALNFGALAQHQGVPAERQLLERSEEAVTHLDSLSAADCTRVRQVLDTITSGQELDLRRFPVATVANLIALQNDAELDDYTYRVAGCVGEFWTAMCQAHLSGWPKAAAGDINVFAVNGVRFGKGLQLVNILRDLPADLRKGRCYLPAEQLATVGLKPADLLSPNNEAKLRPLYHRYLDQAESHLAAGWDYTNAIPFRRMNLRLACAWPILIGFKTIARLRAANVLEAGQRVKVSRAEIRGIIFRSVWTYPFPGVWRRQARLAEA